MAWRLGLLTVVAIEAASISNIIPSTRDVDCNDILILEQDNPGNWHGLIALKPEIDINEWTVEITFDNDLTSLLSPAASVSGSGSKWTLTNRDWDGSIGAGQVLELRFVVQYDGYKPLATEIFFNNDVICKSEEPGPSPSPDPCPDTGTCTEIFVIESESAGNWQGIIAITPEEDIINGWVATIELSAPATTVQTIMGDVTGSNTMWTISSKGWDGDIAAGDTLNLRFIVYYEGSKPTVVSISLNEKSLCSGGGGDCGNTGEDCTNHYSIDDQGEGFWKGTAQLVPTEDVHGWTLKLHFNQPVDEIDSAAATPSGSGQLWTLTSRGWDDDILAGQSLAVALIVHYSGSMPSITSMNFNENSLCSEGSNPTQGPDGPDCSEVVTVNNQDGNSWTGSMDLETAEPVESWTVDLLFDNSVDSLAAAAADVSGSGTSWRLTNKDWDGGLNPGESLNLAFLVQFSGNFPSVISASFNGVNLCSGGDPAPTNHPSTTTNQPITDCPYGIITVYEDGSLASCPNFAINNEWGEGFVAALEFTVDHDTSGSWVINLGFDKSFTELVCFQGDATTTDGKNYRITNKEWDGDLHSGESFKIEMQATFATGGKPDLISADIDGSSICGGSSPTTSTTTTTTTQPGPTTTTCAPPPTKPEDSTTRPPPQPCTYRKWFNTTKTKVSCHGLAKLSGKYAYDEVLCESMLFYEAERSGKLPSDNRVPWRDDSALDDLVPGGYYDAGDFVKFGFPMASMTTMLAWGGVSFPDGYDISGQTEWFTKTLKWSTDYFIAAHLADTEFVGQIGDGDADHANWGRPEDMTMNRPAFKITASAPGSELAAETAAALAASAIWYRCNGDESYANQCLEHAKTLYAFADQYRGKYTDAIPNAANFYNSFNGFNDELVWGAAWLAKATGDNSYLEKAETYFEEFGLNDPMEMSWDDKTAGVFLILYELTGNQKYAEKASKFVDYFLNLERTAKGLVWSSNSQWGSLRYAANYAHFGVQAARLGIKKTEGNNFAKSQIDYILGDTGRSYVVGWGVDPPTHCHHRAASCPDRPAVCDWNSGMNNPGPNHQVLHGALVGGPDHNDNYVDDRNQFQMTEVATDYNAGFQSCLAAIVGGYTDK